MTNQRIITTILYCRLLLSLHLICQPGCRALISQPPSNPLAFRNFQVKFWVSGESQDGSEPEDFEESDVLDPASPMNKDVDRSRFKGVQSAFQTAALGVSNQVDKRTSGLKSAAIAASTGIAGVAGKGTGDIKSFASSAGSKLSRVTERGQGDLKTTSQRAKAFVKRGTDDAIGLAERGVSDLKSLTQQGTTTAGEVARWIDSQAKSGTEIVSSKTKSLVLNFTGQEIYRFGDVTKEVLRRIASQEVNMKDTILLLKILLTLGASFGPLVKVLPFTVLLEALNVSLEQKIGGKVLEAIAVSLDDRLVAAFTSDDKFQLGDAVKRSLLAGIVAYTGKDKYESGDIQRKVAEQEQEEQNTEEPQTIFDGPAESVACTTTYLETPSAQPIQTKLVLRIDPEFEEWDRLFRENCSEDELALICSESDDVPAGSFGQYNQNQMSAKTMDMKIASELEEWDEMFQRLYPDSK